MRAEILDPLALSDTSPDLAGGPDDELAAGHTALSYATERRVIDHVGTAALAPATGFLATAADLVAFYSALLPGDDRLLGDDTQRQLRHRIWDVRKAESWYGLGVSLLRVGEHDLFGHGGGFPGHITRTLACPKRRVVAAVLTNAIDGPAEPLATALFSLLDATDSASHQLAPDGARFVGRFANLWGVLDVALLGGRLFALNPMVANPADDPVALEVVDGSTLRMVSGPGSGSIGESMHYEFAADGAIRSVRGGSAMTMHPFEIPG